GVIRELARQGAGVDAAPAATGTTALHMASRMNEAGSIGALVEAGASVITQTRHGEEGINHTPLHSAAEALALDAMLALLRHGAPALDPLIRASQKDGVNRSKRSRLHIAARQGGTMGASEAVDLLLRWGADESELDDNGNTAADVIGAEVREDESLAADDADRVRELLANDPADRAWRRRGLLLLCFARDQRTRGRG
ncbi:unnamed protein product, partial [Laminaria digitata]